jgi:hypothetical protein
MSNEGKPGGSGVLGGSPAALFENLDDDERTLEDNNPFKLARRRGGGSRRGVPNKRTEDFRRYYASLGLRDPLLFLGHCISIDTADLARELGCKAAAALDVQRKAAADLAPYLHSKQPARLDVGDGEGLPVLVVREIDSPKAIREARATGALAIDDDLAETLSQDEQKQAVKSDDAQGSHSDGSHGQEKREE